MPPVTRYAKRGAISIAYQVLGDGPFDIIFVPGFVSHLDLFWEVPTFARTWQRLGSFSRLITFDKRGTGLSERSVGIPTLEERMDDLHAVMDAVGCHRAALIGISEGGPMCLTYAAMHPERTIALILWGSFPRILAAPDYPAGFDNATLATSLRWIEDVWGTGKALGALVFAAAKDDVATLDLMGRAERSAATPATAVAALRFAQVCDMREVLPAISVPTLVIHRADDRFVPAAHGRYLAEHIPGARLRILPGDFHIGAGPDSNDQVVDEIQEFLTGVRPERVPDVDRVLATVLFTDIVGSTGKAARLGDRGWQALLDAHDGAVRAEIGRAQGREVNHTGDGFVAAFDGPARAIRCAQAITAAARRIGLAVRTGLHTGECTVRGEELSGLALHIGARVGALAGAGEVLVTSTVRDLVLGSDFRFEDRGVQALRGVPGEWRILALAAP
jgi:pimeloyl-ACP methyl ester carboxylesterase